MLKKRNTSHRAGAYLVSFFIPAAVLTLLLAAEHVAPFGNNTLLTEDMRRQYVAFYAYYQQVLSDGQNWFYSLRLGLGGGTFGMLTYYLMSPLLLALAFVPKRLFPEFVTCMVIVKCGLIGLTCYAYLSHMIRRIRKRTWLLSTSFALCAFLMANCFNTMWTDAVIILPVLLLCCEKMMEKRSFGWTAGYGLCVTLILAENYYIGYMCLLFTALWVLSLLVFGWERAETASAGVRTGQDKAVQQRVRNHENLVGTWLSKRVRCGLHVLAATIVGLLMSMFLMWPTFCSISGSAKDTQIMADPSAAMNLPVRSVLAKLLSLTYGYTEIFTGLPNIYIGLPAILLVALFFVSARNRLMEKFRIGLLLMILMMSMCISPLNRVWHAGMLPSGYLYRNSLFFSLLLVMAACYGADSWEDSLRKEKLAAAAITGLLLLYAGSASVPVLDVAKRKWNALVYLAMAGSVLVSFPEGTKPEARRGFWTGAALMFLSGLQVMDLSLNQNCIYRVISIVAESRDHYRTQTDEADPVWAGIRNMDPSVYRAESLTPHSENNSLQYGYNGVTHYSSVQQMEDRIFLQNLGFNDTGLLAGYGVGQTAAADALLGIRYLAAGDKVIENRAVLPLFFTGTLLRDEDGAFRTAVEEPQDEGPFAFAESSLQLLTGKDDCIFYEAVISGKETPKESLAAQDLQETYTVKAVADGAMYLFIQGTEEMPQDIKILVDNREIGHFGNNSCRGVLRLGSFPEGGTFLLTLEGNGQAPQYDRLLLVTEDTGALSDMVAPAKDSAVLPQMLSSSHMRIMVGQTAVEQADSNEENALIMLIPWSRNWHITVNGQKIEPVMLLDEYMAVPLPAVPAGDQDGKGAPALKEKENGIEIDMCYVPEGWYAGIIMSALGLVLAGMYALYCGRKCTDRK